MIEKEMGNQSIGLWALSGGIFIVAVGSLLHFVYEWSGYSDVVGLFTPVNESVWEHLKLGFWGLMLWTGFEAGFVRKRVRNYFLAKLVGAILLNGMIVVVFYTYTAFTGRAILAVDIASFAAGVVVCQAVALRISTKSTPSRAAAVIGTAGLALIALCFMVFTYSTPHAGVFRDGRIGAYGPVKMEIGE
jgi:hypothetical protein